MLLCVTITWCPARSITQLKALGFQFVGSYELSPVRSVLHVTVRVHRLKSKLCIRILEMLRKTTSCLYVDSATTPRRPSFGNRADNTADTRSPPTLAITSSTHGPQGRSRRHTHATPDCCHRRRHLPTGTATSAAKVGQRTCSKSQLSGGLRTVQRRPAQLRCPAQGLRSQAIACMTLKRLLRSGLVVTSLGLASNLLSVFQAGPAHTCLHACSVLSAPEQVQTSLHVGLAGA